MVVVVVNYYIYNDSVIFNEVGIFNNIKPANFTTSIRF